MSEAADQLRQNVKVVDYDPRWRELFSAERDTLLASVHSFIELEHIGSTAVPGQRAKPIIDIMTAVHSLDELEAFLPQLQAHGYHLIDADMPRRHFLRRQDPSGQIYHLHIVEHTAWDDRKERLMRDYLLKYPEAVQAYGDLKSELAKTYAEDSVAYTEAKTDFIQNLMDKARAELGLPPIDVWEE